LGLEDQGIHFTVMVEAQGSCAPHHFLQRRG
jgi:hypothetical protein